MQVGKLASDVESLLDVITPAARHPRTVEELPGGLTNRNFKVTNSDGVCVVRIPAEGPGLLGIDREHEYANSVAAATAGVGPTVLHHRPGEGLTVEFLPGRTLTDDDLYDPAVLHRVAAACRQLHAGPRFVNEFDMFARQRWYREVVEEHGFPLPPSYDDHAAAWEDVRRVLTASAGPTVPCNNDLLAGNFIDDGERVWLIDYDYSGNNDPCFELGNTSTECEFGPDLTRAWVSAYFEREDPRLLARVRLQALCSEYGWSLWGFIQAGSSTLDYDFHAWGMHRFEKAARTFSSPEFPLLLAEVATCG